MHSLHKLFRWLVILMVILNLFLLAFHMGNRFVHTSFETSSLSQMTTFNSHQKNILSTVARKENSDSIDEISPKVVHRSVRVDDFSFQSYSTSNSVSGNVYHSNRFTNYDLKHPPVFTMKEDERTYFMKIGNATCLKTGTNVTATFLSKSKCLCLAGWFGRWCSFPAILKESDIKWNMNNLQLSNKPRRIISAMPFNIEFHLTEARFADLYHVTDLFIISESNYTGYGDPKPLHLFQKLKQGFLKEYHEKIVYVYLDYFPEEAHQNGWIEDNLIRDVIGQQGMKNQVRGVRHDDIYLMLDADEIPKEVIILFLKLHTGYPEPFGFHLWKTTYGFFWRGGTGDTIISCGVTVGMLAHVFEYKASRVRNPSGHLPRLALNVKAYLAAGGNISMWSVGKRDRYTGWHCSWCFDIEGIRSKLVSAINADFPRWGDYPEKRKLTYIKQLVKKGKWFDDKTYMKAVSPSYHMYAPNYVLQHREKYKYLLQNHC